MPTGPFPDAPRHDAREKVLGAARYGADHAPEGMLFAILAVSEVARGAIAAIDTAEAQAAPGVRLVLTHQTIDGLENPGSDYRSSSIQPLLADRVSYRGQPVAMIVADSLEEATHAASLVVATIAPEPFAATIESEGAEVIAAAESDLPPEIAADTVAGTDAEGAFAAAPVQVDATFRIPPQHQNPIELLSTLAEWDGEALTVHEGTQSSTGVQHGLAAALGVPPAQVRVVSPYIGGGFGQKGSMQMQTALVAHAARVLGRPVKMVVPRSQVVHAATFRPATLQRVRLGADADGRMVAALYDIDSQTSRDDLIIHDYASTAAQLYGIAEFRGFQRMVRTDTHTPGYMRAPGPHPACFAFEGAVDELAVALGMDPVELRLLNDTQTDLVNGVPLSSRFAAECLRTGAEMFGWSGRNPEPGSMVAEDGSLIGWGVALGAYPVSTAPCVARATADDQGGIRLEVGGHEMGQGIRSAIAAVAARRLGVGQEAVTVSVGVTGTVPQHETAGSWGTATAIPATEAACDNLLAALEGLGGGTGTPAERLRAAGEAELSAEAVTRAPGQEPQAVADMRAGLNAAAGPFYPEFTTFSYIAHFVEVRVEPTTRRVRVPRVVSVVDCGRVLNPRVARSQVIGGVVWGIGAALREESEVDARYGGFLNADIADYVVPVNADVGEIETAFVDRPDPLVNPAGVKGLGEVVMTGVAPAIANAVFHATGRRIRDFPIRIEDVL